MPKACFSGFSSSYAPWGSTGGGGHWKDGGDGGALAGAVELHNAQVLPREDVLRRAAPERGSLVVR